MFMIAIANDSTIDYDFMGKEESVEWDPEKIALHIRLNRLSTQVLQTPNARRTLICPQFSALRGN